MMSRNFRMSSELSGAIAKRLPHAKNYTHTHIYIYIYRYPSPFAGVTFLRIAANGKIANGKTLVQCE